MTLTTQLSTVTYPGAGSTGPFPFTFRVMAATHLVVTRTIAAVPTVLTLGVDYTVTGIGNRTGGSVLLTTALAVGQSIEIERVVPLTQLTSLRNQGAYYPETVEDALDYLMMVAQQIAQSGGALTIATPSSGPFGSWSSAVTYVVNDTAVSGGIIYRCILGHTNHAPPNATYWEVFVTSTIDELDAAGFGVVGNGVNDDTAALQAALTAGAAQNRVVTCGKKVVKITGALAMAGPGLVFDTVSYGNAADPGILVTGAGYTALTVTGTPSQMRFTLYGSGNTANGIYFNNANFMQVQKIRVFNLDGFGVKFDRLWDSFVADISVELCGNATNYAFSMNGAGDTCNASRIGRLQVERANRKAIYIDPTSINCAFGPIHSERAVANAADVTWDIGASRSVFDALRLHATVPANAKIQLHGENSTYNAVHADGDIAVELDASSFGTLTFNSPNFNAVLTKTVSILTTNHSGRIVVNGGQIGTLNTGAEVARILAGTFIGVDFTTVTIGDVGNPGDPKILQFYGCKIGTLSSASANSAASFYSCAIAEGGNLLEYHTVLGPGTVVACAGTLGARGCVTSRGATINANVLIASGATWLGYGTRFNGTLGQTANCSSLMDSGCYATGAVTGLGIPTSQPSVQAQVGAVWRKGQRHHNLAPAAGGAPGWVCTTEGGTGVFVFKAESNLAP